MQDVRGTRWQFAARDRRYLHDDDVLRALPVYQRKDRGVSQIAAVPIVLAIDFDRLEVGRKAGGGEHGLDADRGRLKNLDLAGADIGCVEEKSWRLRRAIEPVKIDRAQQQFPERIEIERIE